MIVRREGEWIVAYDDNLERELIRVKPPEGGLSQLEMEKFRAHLLKLIAERDAKPN